MQASGVEKTVITPKLKQDILRVDYLVPVLAKSFQDFRFTMGSSCFTPACNKVCATGSNR